MNKNLNNQSLTFKKIFFQHIKYQFKNTILFTNNVNIDEIHRVRILMRVNS